MITFDLPIRVGLGLNSRQHWRVRARLTKRERETICIVAKNRLWQSPVALPAVVTITKRSAGRTDGDNLQGALKAVRDGIADAMGINDGGAQVEWRYQQEKCKRGTFGVRVTIEARAA